MNTSEQRVVNLIFLSVLVSKSPRVAEADRSKLVDLSGHTFPMTLNYGYMQFANVSRDIKDQRFGDIKVDNIKISIQVEI